MQDVHDEPLFAERVAGLDIAKAEVEVTIRVPSDTTAGRRQQETRTFGTTRRELESLGDWLTCWGVTKIGMEATSDYWKPVFFLLESRGFDCQLYNAAQVKALPGRPKTDRADSIWLAKIVERGMISSSFVPPEPIRRLRTHTRYRRHLTQARTAEKQRAAKLLEDGHLKLSSVISDIHGVSGRAIPAPDRADGRRARHREDQRPGRDRRNRRGHDSLPHRLPPGVLGQVVPPGQPVRRQTQRKQRLRPRQPLPVRRPRRNQHQRRPHPVIPRRQIPAACQAHAQKESPRRHRQLRPDHLPCPAL